MTVPPGPTPPVPVPTGPTPPVPVSPGPTPSVPATRTAGRVVVLVSGTGSTLGALLAAHDDPAYGARVVAVVSDRPGVRALELARAAGVATAVVAPAQFPDRAAWDRALAETVRVFTPDLVVLAGFMRLVGHAFLAEHAGRTLNTHPALLPAFPGAHAVRDALAHGVKVSGCSVIVVDEGVDSGPIVAQAAVPVLADDDEAALHERIKTVERALLVDVVGRVVRNGIVVEGRHVRLGGGPVAG